MTRATTPALRICLIVLSIALLVALALAWRGAPDAAVHAAYGRDLRRAQALDARLNEEVAKSRLGIVNHYDGLVRVWDEIVAIEVTLARTPELVDAQGRAEMAPRLAAYRAALRRKEALVESFKTEQSVLRNSVRAFPLTVARAIDALAGDQSAAPLREALSRLEHLVMLTLAAPSRDVAQRARCALAALDTREPSRDTPTSRCTRGTVPGLEGRAVLLAPVLAHGAVVIERQPRVERLVGGIVRDSVVSRAVAVLESYTAAYHRADTSSRIRWLMVFALVLAVLAMGAADVIARLTSSKRALEDASSRLSTALAELQIERDREMELAALKSRFVAMTSHEFRTPLSVILSSAELLDAYGEHWPREKQTKHLRRIEDSAKGMSRMLDDVLLIGRAEAGMVELSPRPLELRRFCDELVDEARLLFGSTRRLSYVNTAPDEPVWLDEKLLRHVLTNLLSNAFKYSGADALVTFTVEQSGSGASFDVRDEGIGIPPEDLDRLFEAFHRCGNAGLIPGTGLGLAVVKRSLDVHGGSITVESELGIGTRFHVEVPLVGQRVEPAPQIGHALQADA